MSLTRFRSFFIFGSKIGKFIIVNKILGFFCYSVDILMVYFILDDATYGFVKAFLFGGVLNFVLCSSIVAVNNYLNFLGFDITGLQELKSVSVNKDAGKIKSLLINIKDWIFARRLTIFWVGSWYMLDPDYVTILLQRDGSSLTKTVFSITLPSVILAMIIWTSFYWLILRWTALENEVAASLLKLLFE